MSTRSTQNVEELSDKLQETIKEKNNKDRQIEEYKKQVDIDNNNIQKLKNALSAATA